MTDDRAPDDLIRLVSQSLAFQRKWQRLSMTAYVASTVLVLFCTTAATYAAAGNYSQAAAIFAAVSTILIGLEKSLLFREKWKFHLAIATRLFNLSIKLQLEGADAKVMAEEYAIILDNYASSIPIAGREDR